MLSDDKHVMEIKSNCEWSFICGVFGSLFDAFLRSDKEEGQLQNGADFCT